MYNPGQELWYYRLLCICHEHTEPEKVTIKERMPQDDKWQPYYRCQFADGNHGYCNEAHLYKSQVAALDAQRANYSKIGETGYRLSIEAAKKIDGLDHWEEDK